MVNSCSVPKCRTNYCKDTKGSCFKFPTDPELRNEWITRIKRHNFIVTKYSKVCELHFKPCDIIREASAFDEKTGRTISASLLTPRLSRDAVPSQFPNVSGFKSKKKKRIQDTASKVTVKSKPQDNVMPACAVASCSNHNRTKAGASTTYHRFPKDTSLRKLWIDACRRKDEFNVVNARICSEHFCETDYVRDLRAELLQKKPRMELIESAVPSLKIPGLIADASNSEQRPQRLQTRKIKHKIQVQSVQSGVQEQTESILPDVAALPNLDIVKKEPLDYTEESITSPAQNIPSSSGCMLSVKSEPSDDCVDGSAIPVTPDDTSLPTTSTYIIESSSKSMPPYACTDNAEPPAKRPNISQNPVTSNTETKDVFTIFGDFVAAKLRNFADRRLQVEAQHRITNMLFEIEMDDVNGDSLPVISKISS